MNDRSEFSRRQFLKTTAAAAIVSGLATTENQGAPAATRRPMTVTCRDAYLKMTGQPDCWSAMKELGVDGVEVVVDEAMLCPGLYQRAGQYHLATPDDARKLKDDFASHGMTLTALCMSNRFDERLPEEIAWTSKVVQAADQLGVRAVRIDVVPRKLAVDAFLPFAIKACQQICEVAAGTAVRFGIENHGRITNDPAFLEKLFAGVNSSRLGLTLDVMNFYWFGHPLNNVYPICETFAARVVHTHCKNLRYPDDKKNVRRPMGWEYGKYAAPVYAGDIDYSRVVSILRKAGYHGDLCLENECLGHFPKDQHVAVLKKEIARLRSLA